MLTFSQSKEVQFVYISVHKHPYLKLMASMETKYLKGLDGTYSQNRRQGYSYRGNKKLGDKVPIRATHSANPSHSSTGRELNLSKIDESGGQESENVCQKTQGWWEGGGGLWVWGGPRKNGGGTFFLEIEGGHIIFKYFLKILMMQHTKKISMYLSFLC